MEIKHSEACIQAQAKYEREKAEYEAQWPNYCRNCHGWGVVEGGGDLVPYGSTNVHLPSYSDPCSACSEEGICPRCGAHSLSEETEWSKCDVCGWELNKTPGLPEGPECWCWEDPKLNPQLDYTYDPSDDLRQDWLREYFGMEG